MIEKKKRENWSFISKQNKEHKHTKQDTLNRRTCIIFLIIGLIMTNQLTELLKRTSQNSSLSLRVRLSCVKIWNTLLYFRFETTGSTILSFGRVLGFPYYRVYSQGGVGRGDSP